MTKPTIKIQVNHFTRRLRDGEALAALFWPTDGHHTSEGYAVLGTIIAEQLMAGALAAGP